MQNAKRPNGEHPEGILERLLTDEVEALKDLGVLVASRPGPRPSALALQVARWARHRLHTIAHLEACTGYCLRHVTPLPPSTFVAADARALLRQARVDPEALIRRYLSGDLGTPSPMSKLMNDQMKGSAGTVGRYELDGHGVILIRRRRSGIVCVMDGASVLSSLGGL